jgi:hypothetical protein
MPDGQLPPGAGLALLVLFSLGPLVWGAVFELLCAGLNAYTWHTPSGSVHRTELRLTAVGLATLLTLVTVAGASLTGPTGTLTLPFIITLYIAFTGVVTVHYLYLVYHVVAPGSGATYLRLFFGRAFVLILLLTVLIVPRSFLILI